MILVLRVTGDFHAIQTAARDWRRELGEGFAFLRASRLLRMLAWTTGFWNLLHQIIFVALVLHGQENLGLSAEVYGLVLAGGAVGGMLGSLAGQAIAAALAPVRTTQVMLATSAPAFAGMALAPATWTLALVFAAFEFFGLVWNIVSVSNRQRSIPDALLGRVNGLYRLLAWGMMPVGLLLSGVIVHAADGPFAREVALTLPFWAAALGALLLTIAAWRGLARGFAGDPDKKI